MNLVNIRGQKANKNRWDALKTLDWDGDKKVIERIFSVTNPLFFSSRTVEEIISSIHEELKYEDIIKNCQ